MPRISLSQNNEVALPVTLTAGQVAKFNSLANKLIVKNGAAYIPLNELHGVLLTNSRQSAINIINAYRDIVRPFLVDTLEIPGAIVPIGVYTLLEQLAVDKSRRALEYRASLTLLACIVGSNPQLAFEAQRIGDSQTRSRALTIARLKRKHRFCQLCREQFGNDGRKHAHHIIGESERPDLAADENNILIIKESIHDAYHAWVNERGCAISGATLRNFARHNGYSTDWLNDRNTG